ncbi:MAG TPA: hypothetical protein PKN56_15270 [Leptospiraceae bacterium]|nr:hypothetical protein [Leptospiraceae bacterium]HNF26761.1 hypothetical protein [Leptospiraceae bacterium]HNH10083.1 hypothetical protein [Leptospiraceae bacterium]HNI94475.1 hypothetical protein [Leptospiraceae bacterium]HNM06322.1 hypothetical protein [Leptospiraceae bacterium]
MYELKNIALNIAGEADSPPEKAVRLHDFVRDRIRFGLTHKLDFAGAEETMELGYGTSSTKGLLLMKLLSEADINSQMHFVTVKKDFYRHCFPDVVYSLMPETVTHCYLEINVDGTYIPTDSYSVERKLFLEARKVLEGIGEKCGFGIHSEGSCDWNGKDPCFSQFSCEEQLVEDHGAFKDPFEYYMHYDSYKHKFLGIRYSDIMKLIGSMAGGNFEIWINSKMNQFRSSHS